MSKPIGVLNTCCGMQPCIQVTPDGRRFARACMPAAHISGPKGMGPAPACLLCSRPQCSPQLGASRASRKPTVDFRLQAQPSRVVGSKQVNLQEIAALCASLGYAVLPELASAEAQQDALRTELMNAVACLRGPSPRPWNSPSHLADLIIACEALGVAWNALLVEAEATFEDTVLQQLSRRQVCQLAMACCARCAYSPLTPTLLTHLSAPSHPDLPLTLALPLLQQLLDSHRQLPHDRLQLMALKCTVSLKDHVKHLTAKQVALVVCSLGVLQPTGIHREQLLAFSQRFGACLKNAEGESVSRVLVGFARLGWRPPLLIQQVVSHLNRQPSLLQQFSTPDLVHLLWALARLHASGPPTLNLIKTTSILLLLDHTAPNKQLQALVSASSTTANTTNPSTGNLASDSTTTGMGLDAAGARAQSQNASSTTAFGSLQAAAMQFATNIMTAASAMAKPSTSFPSSSAAVAAAAAAAAAQKRPTASNTQSPGLPPPDLFDLAMFTADLPTADATTLSSLSLSPPLTSSNSSSSSSNSSSSFTSATVAASSASSTIPPSPLLSPPISSTPTTTSASFTLPNTQPSSATVSNPATSATSVTTAASSDTTAAPDATSVTSAATATTSISAASTSSIKAPRRRLTAKELSVVAWACVRCGYSNKTLLSQLLRLLMAAAPAASAPAGLQPMVLAQVVWACGHLKFWQPGLEGWLEAHLTGELREGRVGSQNVAMVAWGMAACGKRPSAQFAEALLDASTLAMDEFEPRELCALAWAAAGWKLNLPGSFSEAAIHHLEAHCSRFSMRDACSTVMSLDRLLPSLPHRLLSILEGKLLPHLHPLHYPALSWFLFCCQRNNYRPTRLIPPLCHSAADYLSRVSIIELDELTPRYEAEARALGMREKVDVRKWPAQLAALVFGLGCHATWVAKGTAEDRQAMGKVMALAEVEAARRPTLLPPGAMAGLLWGMSEAQHAPSSWLQRGLHRAVRRSVPAMSFKDLSLTLMALSKWHQQRDMDLAHAAYAQAPAINRLLLLFSNLQHRLNPSQQYALVGGSGAFQGQGSGGVTASMGAAGTQGAVVGRDEELKPHVLVDVAVALSHLPCYSSRLINSISACTISSLGAFNGRTLTALLAALATLRHDEPRLLRAVARAYPSHPQWRLPNLGAVQRLLSAYAKLNHQPGEHVLQAAHQAVHDLHVLDRLQHMATATGSKLTGSAVSSSIASKLTGSTVSSSAASTRVVRGTAGTAITGSTASSPDVSSTASSTASMGNTVSSSRVGSPALASTASKSSSGGNVGPGTAGMSNGGAGNGTWSDTSLSAVTRSAQAGSENGGRLDRSGNGSVVDETSSSSSGAGFRGLQGGVQQNVPERVLENMRDRVQESMRETVQASVQDTVQGNVRESVQDLGRREATGHGIGRNGNGLAATANMAEAPGAEEDNFVSGDEWEVVWPSRESVGGESRESTSSLTNTEFWASERGGVANATSNSDDSCVDVNMRESGAMYSGAPAASSFASSSQSRSGQIINTRDLGINERNSFVAPNGASSSESCESNGVSLSNDGRSGIANGNGTTTRSSSSPSSTASLPSAYSSSSAEVSSTADAWTVGERGPAASGSDDASCQPSTSGRTHHSTAHQPLSRQEINTLCTLMYYLAIMRQHNSHISHALGLPLAAILESDPKLLQASGRWAGACLVLATADGTKSPFHSLSPTAQERCLQLWKQHVKREASPKSSYPVLRDICKVLQSALGLETRASHFTKDAAASVDISFRYTGRLMSLELLLPGRNCCRNTLRLSGQGSMRRRLQQARGYHVLYVSRKAWTDLGTNWPAKIRFMRKLLNEVPGRKHLGAFDEVHITQGGMVDGRDGSAGEEWQAGVGAGEDDGTPMLRPPPSIGTSRIPALVQSPSVPQDGASQRAADTVQSGVWPPAAWDANSLKTNNTRAGSPARLRLQSAASY